MPDQFSDAMWIVNISTQCYSIESMYHITTDSRIKYKSLKITWCINQWLLHKHMLVQMYNYRRMCVFYA